ncbi:hypothetical protein DFJ73DRAFT_761269 [Zopfochytrium polystomum]|nr:hypothetical protein DFJ73DRAFT_761269 [Zopfochytrium polystomum]
MSTTVTGDGGGVAAFDSKSWVERLLPALRPLGYSVDEPVRTDPEATLSAPGKPDRPVALKAVPSSSPEAAVVLRLRSLPDAASSSPFNHVVRWIDVVEVDDILVLVSDGSPQTEFYRSYGSALGVLVAFRFVLETIAFLHEHQIALGHVFEPDFVAKWENPENWNLPFSSDVSYTLLDLEFASIVDSPTVRFDTRGRYFYGRPAPELSSTAPYDAYKFDVFNAGVMMDGYGKKLDAWGPFPRMEDFKALVSKMTAEDPKLRPTALDCLRELSALISAL